jgi:N-acetylglucosamine-6-phosphate deacetylase
MMALRGNLVTPFQKIEHGQIEVKDSKIHYVGPRRPCKGVVDHGDATIAPGFIDIHVHGIAGHDAMDIGTGSLQQISQHLASRGVTGFLATLQTAPQKEVLKALTRVKREMRGSVSGAKVLGTHLEGPFISPNRMGAQQNYVREPTQRQLEEIYKAAGGTLKIVTLAPEVKGGLDAAKFLRKHNIVVSAGHTDATYHETRQAFDAGVSHLGHFWNGIRGVHHREPGVVGAGLEDENVTVELIADCLHVHPTILGLTVKVKGPEKVVLISDLIKPAGFPNGEYVLDGRTFQLDNGLIKLPSGVIAGSSVGLDKAVRNMVEKVGVSLPVAVQMATATPAKVLGLDEKGRLKPGLDADIVIMDENFNVIETIVEGSTVYKQDA